jgi:hypothetical protein
MLGKMATLNREEVVSLGRVSDCAVSRQMSASLIKLDFRPVSREAKRERGTFRKNSEISKTSLFFQQRSVVYFLFQFSSFSFLSFP